MILKWTKPKGTDRFAVAVYIPKTFSERAVFGPFKHRFTASIFMVLIGLFKPSVIGARICLVPYVPPTSTHQPHGEGKVPETVPPLPSGVTLPPNFWSDETFEKFFITKLDRIVSGLADSVIKCRHCDTPIVIQDEAPSVCPHCETPNPLNNNA